MCELSARATGVVKLSCVQGIYFDEARSTPCIAVLAALIRIKAAAAD